MFNVTILKMKDIIKYFIGIVTTILLVIIISKHFSKNVNEKKIIENVKNEVNVLSEQNLLECMDKTIPVISNVNDEYRNIASEKDISEDNDIFESILKNQISLINGIELAEEKSNIVKENQEVASYNNVNNNEQNSNAIVQVENKTKVITSNPIKESYNIEYGKVKIKNQTAYELTRRNDET